MKYAIGERLTYYPKPAFDGENRHFEVEVKSITRRGRYRVEGIIRGGGIFHATVTARRLTRQQLLEV